MHPDIGPELRKLAQKILDQIDPAVRLAASRADGDGAGTGKCQQVWCPVCALAAVVTGEEHPMLTVIAEHSVALLAVIRAVIDQVDHPPPPPDDPPGGGAGPKRQTTPARRVAISPSASPSRNSRAVPVNGSRRIVEESSRSARADVVPHTLDRYSWRRTLSGASEWEGSMWYWLFKYIFMGPLLALLGRPKIEGLEHVPHSGPAILASNHLAVADSFYLPLVVRRRITFLAKSEYFTGTGLKGWFKRWFFTAAGQVPIDRSDADAAQGALDTAERVLGQGKLLGMYPEGTRSPDGRLYKGKTGLARLALQTGVPVIPVAMIGTNVVNPPGSKMWRFGRVTVRFGKPMDFSRFEGLAGNRFIERAVIDEVIYELMGLSGQEYVDIYAADDQERRRICNVGEPAGASDPEKAAG